VKTAPFWNGKDHKRGSKCGGNTHPSRESLVRRGGIAYIETKSAGSGVALPTAKTAAKESPTARRCASRLLPEKRGLVRVGVTNCGRSLTNAVCYPGLAASPAVSVG
jgi:hypothetical protein